MIFSFLLLSLFDKSVFSSTIGYARLQIEEIIKITGETPTTSALSTFLGDDKNWGRFSKELEKGENNKWLKEFADAFDDLIIKKLLTLKAYPLIYPKPIGDLEKALHELGEFIQRPDKVDHFFPLWIEALKCLNLLHKNNNDEEILKYVIFDDLPNAAYASELLLNVFKKKIDEGIPLDCDQDFLKKLKDAIKVKVPKPDDTPGGPPSVPPDGWSTQKKILVFGGIGVVIVSAILIVLLVLRKPRPAIVPTA